MKKIPEITFSNCANYVKKIVVNNIFAVFNENLSVKTLTRFTINYIRNIPARRSPYAAQLALYQGFYDGHMNRQWQIHNAIENEIRERREQLERVEIHNAGDSIEEIVGSININFPSFMQEYMQIPIRKYKDCPVCKVIMNKYKDFPKWYPEKWKLCCKCVDAFNVAHNLPRLSRVGWDKQFLIQHYKKYEKELDERFYVQ